jgi:hypothetical protein
MAFPGTFNINYYRGDTYEFKIYPKNANGEAFSLTGYDLTEGVKFTISTQRGAEGLDDQIEAYAVISGNHIDCAILPENGTAMAAGTSYVYDVEISKTGSPYDLVTTLLTGEIRVQDQITGAV